MKLGPHRKGNFKLRGGMFEALLSIHQFTLNTLQLAAISVSGLRGGWGGIQMMEPPSRNIFLQSQIHFIFH